MVCDPVEGLKKQLELTGPWSLAGFAALLQPPNPSPRAPWVLLVQRA